MTTRAATAAEVRKHYLDRRQVCRISHVGRVEFRPARDWHPGASPAWLEGRWVCEYRVADDGTVFLP